MTIEKLTRDINAIKQEISTHQGVIDDLRKYMSGLIIERHNLNGGIKTNDYVQTPRCKNIWVDNYITPIPVNGFVTNVFVANDGNIYADVKMDDDNMIVRFHCPDLTRIRIKKRISK